jgi:hypothetical protein
MRETRFLRFAVWALLTFSAFLIIEIVAPHRAIFVPCLFVPLMVPMVLMPFRKSQA